MLYGRVARKKWMLIRKQHNQVFQLLKFSTQSLFDLSSLIFVIVEKNKGRRGVREE